MARVVIKMGDVFAVKIDEQTVKYFQYVANDSRQLSSNVIRVFGKRYYVTEPPGMADIISGEVEFYKH